MKCEELEWDEYDDGDGNTELRARSPVYEEDFYYRVYPAMQDNGIVWLLEDTSAELLPETHPSRFCEADSAQHWCEENNKEHWESVKGEL